jgi:serine/threonine protein kinase
MPAPTTIDEFLDLVRKSGVVDEKRLAAHVDRLRGSGPLPTEPTKLAGLLVRDGILTRFQAEQVLQGKWRRFTIGKYRVLEPIGSGGMGTVYLCEHMLMRRRVAIKVLPPGKAQDTSALERFRREARAVAALDHPNIVRAYDIDEDKDLHFLVMEHVDGSNLQEIIKKTGPMDVLRAAHYIRQAALGLQHAHDAAALVHRDIKPGNILVDRNGIVKILDMGLARFFLDEEDVLTKKYDENVLGTADYLAPEQALDSHSVDIRADVYSLGGTFYFCLTGRTPFAEGSVAQKLIWHQTRQPRPIRSLRPEVPEALVSIIDRMMAKDVNRRYQWPQEVADALAPFTQTPIPPPPECEMPQLSPASAPRSLIGGEGGMSSSNRSTSDSPPPPSPTPRKSWQVSGTATAAPAAETRPSAGSQSTTPRDPRPAAAPQPGRNSVAPAPRPAVVNNGATRPQPAATEQYVSEQVGFRHPAEPEPLPEVNEPDEGFTDLGERTRTSTATRRRAAPGTKSGEVPIKFVILLALAVLLGLAGFFALVLYGVASVFFSRKPTPEAVVRKPIVVGHHGLGVALRGARPGDRIVLSDDIEEAGVDVKIPDITIEAEQGKQIVWKCPRNVDPLKNEKLLIIQTGNVTVRNLTLDGDNKTQALVMLNYKCPGTRLEKLKLINTRQYGVLAANCVGTAENKVTLHRLDFQTAQGQSAIRFLIFGDKGAFRKNRFFSIKDCNFVGDGHKITTDDPSHVDLQTFDPPELFVVK